MMRVFSVCSVLALGLFASQSHAEQFIGVGYEGHVYQFQSDKPGCVDLGSSGFTNLNSLARDRTGSYYTAGSLDGGPTNHLIRIDPQTGIGTSVAQLNLAVPSIRAMAFSPDNVLYALNDENPATYLYRINPLDGQATRIASTWPLQGLEFGPNGILYGYSVNNGLLIINPTTGLVTDVNGYMDMVNMQSIVFGRDGHLYGAGDHNLYTIDPATGTTTLLCSDTGMGDPRGIEILPEPLSAAYLLGGLAFLHSRRKRRK